MSAEPTFSRLFTQETWDAYTGQSPRKRWFRNLWTWRYSTVARAVLPLVALAAAWSLLVVNAARASHLLAFKGSPLPVSLQGTAIGLLLVFRTNNSYQRLAEARMLWGRIIYLARELVQGAYVYLVETLGSQDPERVAAAQQAALQVGRYVVAFGWALSARLRSASAADVLAKLLGGEEAAWVSSQRSPPLALIRACRRVLAEQNRAGNLPAHLHYKLEEDLRELDMQVGGCERLYSSPIPPTMSRHVVRCLLLWLGALPLVLQGSTSAVAIAGFVAATTYIFVGIEELGVQVEQPFDILPLFQLCHLIQRNVEESLVPTFDTRRFVTEPFGPNASTAPPFADRFADE